MGHTALLFLLVTQIAVCIVSEDQNDVKVTQSDPAVDRMALLYCIKKGGCITGVTHYNGVYSEAV